MGSRAAVRTGPPRVGDYLACAASSREPYRIITSTVHPVRAHVRCSHRVGLRICDSVFLAAPLSPCLLVPSSEERQHPFFAVHMANSLPG